jgi:hypothetical protein
MNVRRTTRPTELRLSPELHPWRRYVGTLRVLCKGCVSGWLSWCLGVSVVCAATALAQPEIIVGSVAAQPGWVVELDVSLRKNGHDVRGAGVHIFFDPRYTPVAQRERGVPDCWVAPGVAQEGRFAFWPPGCWQWDETCDTLRAILVGLGSERPTLPDGPLFTCRVQVSPSAAPGRYELANDFADASDGAGTAIVPTRVSGAVIVSQPPGGGGCAIARSGEGPWTHVAVMLIFLLALRWYRWLRQLMVTAGCDLTRASGRCIVVVFLVSIPCAGLAQSAGTIIEISGRWWRHGSDDFGEWQGTVTLFPDGGLSGSVTLRSKDEREVLNLSATVRDGGSVRGRLRNPRGRLAGKFVGNWGSLGFAVEPQVAIAGSLSRRSGERLQWRVDRIDVRQKRAPAEVVADLAAGKARRLAVIVDTYPAERAARSRNPNRTERATLSPNEQAVLASELRSLNESLVRALRDYGAEVPSVVGNVPSFVIIVPNLDVLRKVLAHPLVREVVVPVGDRGWTVEPLLSESLPLIGQPLVESRLRGGGVPLRWSIPASFGT